MVEVCLSKELHVNLPHLPSLIFMLLKILGQVTLIGLEFIPTNDLDIALKELSVECKERAIRRLTLDDVLARCRFAELIESKELSRWE